MITVRKGRIIITCHRLKRRRVKQQVVQYGAVYLVGPLFIDKRHSPSTVQPLFVVLAFVGKAEYSHQEVVQLLRARKTHLAEHFQWAVEMLSSCLANVPDCVALSSRTHSWGDVVPCSRQQNPLTLGWAVTIHEAEGKTLKKVFIDTQRKTFEPGMLYVAVTRVCRIIDLIVVPFPKEFVNALNTKPVFKQRMFKFRRLLNLEKISTSSYLRKMIKWKWIHESPSLTDTKEKAQFFESA